MDPIALSPPPRPSVLQALTVSQLARLIRETVRANPLLGRILVRGEVSNVQAAPAGHRFFTLKDPGAQIDCILFREDAELLGFELEDGMDVVVSGDVDVFPRRIGVVTSEIGAVVHDIITILRRRYPMAHVIVAPALVQGPGAPASLRRALTAVADRVDVVILARGGGSLEDLWCFNDESLARAVATCRVPVVSAIGHETDVTIVDFVADVRAATPSAAAELVSPDAIELAARVNDAEQRLVQEIHDVVCSAMERVKGLGERMSPRGLRRSVEANRERLQHVYDALAAGGPREVGRQRDRLGAVGRRLDLLSPLATLQRGYAIAERMDGHVVSRASEIEEGDALAVRFQDGRVQVHVQEEVA